MTARLAAGMLVAALIRRIEQEGGSGVVLRRGDADAGALLVQLAERGIEGALLERRLGLAGYEWAETGPADLADRPAYLERRRAADPDLWLIELTHARALEILGKIAG